MGIYDIKQHNNGCICDECQRKNWQQTREESFHKESSPSNIDKLITALKAAIRITNINLLHMRHRHKKNDKTSRIILQSEALSIFKGNFVRMVKQFYDSSYTNRMKRYMNLAIDLEEDEAVINDVRITFLDKDYIPKWEQELRSDLTHAIKALSSAEIEQEAFSSILEVNTNRISLGGKLSPNIPKTVFDINLDSIKAIKF